MLITHALHWIAFDFIAQLETRIEQIPGFNHANLAKRLDVSLGRVSQMMNSPGNFTLKNGVLYAGAVDMNVAVVTYPANCSDSPISGDVFRACWEIAGRPTNMFEIGESTVGFSTQSGGIAAIGDAWITPPVNLAGGTGGTDFKATCTAQTDYSQRLITTMPLEAQAHS